MGILPFPKFQGRRCDAEIIRDLNAEKSQFLGNQSVVINGMTVQKFELTRRARFVPDFSGDLFQCFFLE